MSLEPGGFAEKIGNRYESSWVTYQLLRLLDEQISYVKVEPIGTDEEAVDVLIENTDGSKEYHQCKIGHLSVEAWTLATLQSKDLLTKGFSHIQSGSKSYKVISRIGFKLLQDLHESAINSNGSSYDFFKYQIEQVSKERVKIFNELCNILQLNSCDPVGLDKALQFLESFEIQQFNEDNLDHEVLVLMAEKLVYGQASHLINFLQSFPVKFGQLRKQITAYSLKQNLIANNFTFKIYPDHPHIASVIEILNQEFDNSITPFLISNQIIIRSEFQYALEVIKSNPITLIKADAGMGKSAFLLDLKNHFKANGAVILPIRLDQKMPNKNLNRFGEDLGFPYSPILCLENFAKHEKVIVILDQLDALRWTSTHSSNAIEICRQIISQILTLNRLGVDIKVILATRNFDLEDDIQLSNWINSISNDIKQIELKQFESIQIEHLVDQFENYKHLKEEQKNILKIPLWLSIYLVVAQTLGQAPKFVSKLDLIKGFIENRLVQLEQYQFISIQQSSKLLNDIVDLMSRTNKLTISVNNLPTGSKSTTDALISIGLLSKQNNKISFRHQAIYDYQIGLKLFEFASIAPQELLKELGPPNKQTLLKREHLRYALALLYDADERTFCNCIDALLYNPEIRFHLKSLVFNMLRYVENFKAPLKKSINKILDEPELRSHFIRLSCNGTPALIQYLSESCRLQSWLEIDEVNQVQALGLLQSVVEKVPELIITELSIFINKSNDWNQKIYDCLCWNMVNDSEKLFILRKKLIKSGVKSHYIFWDDLVKKYPIRAIDFLKFLCDEQLHATLNNKEDWSDYETECIESLAVTQPYLILEFFLPFLNQYFIGAENEEFDIYKWSHEHATRTALENFIYKALLKLVIKASENIASKSAELFQLLIPFNKNENLIFNRVYGNILLNLDISYADEVIVWLLDNPTKKFKLANDYTEPVWILAGKIIEKFSPHCSNENFKILEENIYYYSSDFNLNEILWRLKATHKNYYSPFWGQTQYFLLYRLDSRRISGKAKQLIQVLNRKFKKYSDDEFCHRSSSIAGFVSSPIRECSKLSNNAWKKLLLTDPRKFKEHSFKKDLTKASVHQFSNSFKNAVTAEPKRFATLALTLPKDIHQDYVDALYSGLNEYDLSRVPDNLKESWEPCPVILIEQVIDHFSTNLNSKNLMNLISDKIKLLSPNYIKLLEKIAFTDEDPKPNELKFHIVGHPENLDEISSQDLHGNTINSTRGAAYVGLSNKFWDDKEFALSHKYIIQNALNDEHAAVRMATSDLLLPMYNYDRNYAFSMFIELCNKDIRNSLSNGYHYYFNNAFEGEFKDSFVKIVKDMIISTYLDVRKEGQAQIAARWLFNGLFEDEIKQSLNTKNKESLLGYTQVINELLGKDIQGYDESKIEYIFKILINIEDEDILKENGQFFNEQFLAKKNSYKLFELFINSKALNFNIYNIFHTLEKSTMNLAHYSNLIVTIIDKIFLNKSSNHLNSVDTDMIIKIIQQLYDAALDEEDHDSLNHCLDVWDKLLISNNIGALSMVKKLDNGLLT